MGIWLISKPYITPKKISILVIHNNTNNIVYMYIGFNLPI